MNQHYINTWEGIVNLPQVIPHGARELQVLINQLRNPQWPIQTTGTGRVLDALAALLGICLERTYEGEPAIRLDHLAQNGDPDRFSLEVPIIQHPKTIINTSRLLYQALELKKNNEKPADIAASCIKSLAGALGRTAVEIANAKGLVKIGISGGCAYNRLLVRTLKAEVEDNNLVFLQHEKIPPGDAGLSTGQAVYAAAYLTHF